MRHANHMRKIFETIKQKWPEYLLEMLVIVFSILGAFALDNWNEERKSKLAEYQLLSSLKTDFQDRLKELTEIQEGREQILLAIDQLFEHINEQEVKVKPTHFDSLLSFLNIQWTFNDQFSALEMLFNTGKINELSNQALRQHLINWPALVEEMLEEQRQYVGNINDMMNELSEYVNLNHLTQYINVPNKPFGSQLKANIFRPNHQGLIRSSSFVNELTQQRIYLLVNIMDGKILIENAKEIIRLLDEETNEL